MKVADRKQFTDRRDWHPKSMSESDYYSYISKKQEDVAQKQKKKRDRALEAEILAIEETLWDE